MSIKLVSEAEITDSGGAPVVTETVKRLDELAFGVRARVAKVEARDVISQRLMEMGVLPGAEIKVIKDAPLGCPLEIEVRGYKLAVRRAEAARVSVIELER